MELDEKKLIDCHVHLAALPEGGNGCYISPKMLKSPLFRFLLWKHGLSPEKPQEANRKYVDDLLTELRASRQVQRAVLLGMDGVYDHAGALARKETDFLISNDYVLQTARDHPQEFLPGVSINPQRRDAVEEVHRCADAGAARLGQADGDGLLGRPGAVLAFADVLDLLVYEGAGLRRWRLPLALGLAGFLDGPLFRHVGLRLVWNRRELPG